MSLKPELVEKKEPPIMTKIKKIKLRLEFSVFRENPILEILVAIDRKLFEKLLLKLKNKKKIVTTTIR